MAQQTMELFSGSKGRLVFGQVLSCWVHEITKQTIETVHEVQLPKFV